MQTPEFGVNHVTFHQDDHIIALCTGCDVIIYDIGVSNCLEYLASFMFSQGVIVLNAIHHETLFACKPETEGTMHFVDEVMSELFPMPIAKSIFLPKKSVTACALPVSDCPISQTIRSVLLSFQ